MSHTNYNCLVCKQANPLPDDIQGILSLGTVPNFTTDYSVTIHDQNGNELYKSTVTSGGAGELSITFGIESVGIFHDYYPFTLTARNLTTGGIDTITDTNGTAADCIQLNFERCDDAEGPYDLILYVEKTCQCETGCNCP